MTYVLIVAGLVNTGAARPFMWSQEFNSVRACEDAKEVVDKMWRNFSYVDFRTICVPK